MVAKKLKFKAFKLLDNTFASQKKIKIGIPA